MSAYISRSVNLDGDQAEISSLHCQLLGWAALAHPEDALIAELCVFLESRGIKAVYWEALTKIPADDMNWIIDQIECGPLSDAVNATLEIVGAWAIGLYHWCLEELVGVIQQVPPVRRSDEALGQIVRAWTRQGEFGADELEEVVLWWLEGARPASEFHSDWLNIMARRDAELEWQIPCELPTIVEGVRIYPILRGAAVQAESARMSNSLTFSESHLFVHEAVLGTGLVFHLADAENPEICATLMLLRRDANSEWQRRHFVAVDDNMPSEKLHLAAALVIQRLNLAIVGQVSTGTCEAIE